MQTVTSTDGTTIACETRGVGEPLVLVTGAMNDRHSPATLADLLSQHFTVWTYDRRCRGDSGDTPPVAVLREIEDLSAVLDESGPAHVFAHSSGACLALDSAASGQPMRSLVVYEPPWRLDPPTVDTLTTDIESALADGRDGDAVKAFLRGAAQVPEEALAHAEQWPSWPGLVALGPALRYDLALAAAGVPDLARVEVATLVVSGEQSPPWMTQTADHVADAITGATRTVLAGAGHNAEDGAVAELVTRHVRGAGA